MTEPELEAVIRRELTAVAAIAVNHDRRIQLTRRMNIAADAILAAADSYALDQYGITADRRAVLAAAATRKART